MLSPCVDWNEIAIRICRGGKKHNVFSPPMNPSDYRQYLRYDPKMFLVRNMRICWSGRPKILADCTSGRKYKRLKKKGKKWQLCLTPHIIAKNDQKNSKFFLMNVSGPLYIKVQQSFWKKTKMTKFDEFLEIFTKIYKRLFLKL